MKTVYFLCSVLFVLFILPSPGFAFRIADPIPPTDGKCVKTGCSGQICSDQDVVSTCEYREEYACYRTAVCERQANGTCGWTETEALRQCLQGNVRPTLPSVSIKPVPTCIPRPACLDQNPACKIAILPEFCPPRVTPTPRPERTMSPVRPTPTTGPRPTCIPRPACLDTEPFCLMPEGANICPPVRPTTTPVRPIPQPPVWVNILPPPMKNLIEMIFLWKNYYGRPTNRETLLEPSQ